MRRFLRPVGLEKYASTDGIYVIGNFQNGFISEVKELEKWEERVPCKNCEIEDCKDRSSCDIYMAYEENHPFSRIMKC